MILKQISMNLVDMLLPIILVSIRKKRMSKVFDEGFEGKAESPAD